MLVDVRENDNLTKGQRTARKILEAAGRCVSKIGVEKTSITAIAKEANLKRSLIAYHFPKKDEIFYKVMVHIVEEMAHEFNEGGAIPYGREGLIFVLNKYMNWFHKRPHYFHCFLHCFYLSSINPLYKDLNTEIQKKAIMRMQGKLLEIFKEENLPEKLVDARTFCEIIHSNLIGTITNFYSTNHVKSYEVFKREWLRILSYELDLFLTFSKSRSSH